MQDGRPELEALSSRIRGGFAWKGASAITTQASRTVLLVILARLLTPEDFGVAGMALVFAGLILTFGDLGISASIIQLDVITEEDKSTAFWVALIMGFALFLLSLVVAKPIASFFGEPEVRWMFVAVGAGFVISALSATQASLLWRRMDFRALEIRNMVATIVSSLLGVGAALKGAGAWSLIVQAMSFSIISAALIWMLSDWTPKFVFSSRSLVRMRSLSTQVFLTRVMQYGERNADKIMIARALGPTSLGIYSIAYSVILVPLDRLLAPLQTVLTPAFAHLKSDRVRTRRLWLRGMRLTVTLILPAVIGVTVSASDAVPVILGEKWDAVAPVLQILAWITLLHSLMYLNIAVYLSTSNGQTLFRLSIFALTLDLAAFGVGLRWGVTGVALAYVLVNTVLVVPAHMVAIRRVLAISLGDILLELRGTLESAAVMAISIIMAREVLVAVDASEAVRLLSVVVVGATAFLCMCLWRERRVFRELDPRNMRDMIH